MTDRSAVDYARPVVRDYGDLRTLTAACFGSGAEDGASKADDNPFVLSSPDFGDPGNCN
jgi:hypothetical protein